MSTTLIWPFVLLQIATVVAIVLFLRMLLHKQLESSMGRIKEMDRENLLKEADLNEKLEKSNREYDTKMQDAEQQADSLLNMTKESSKKMRDDERMKAKEEAKKIIANALLEKEKILNEVKRRVDMRAVDYAVQILKSLFTEDELSGLRSKITKEIIGELFESDNVTELLVRNKEVLIITADKLTTNEERDIFKAIKNRAGEKDIKFSVDKKVVGGFVLKIGHSTIDGSIVHRINRAAIRVKEQI